MIVILEAMNTPDRLPVHLALGRSQDLNNTCRWKAPQKKR